MGVVEEGINVLPLPGPINKVKELVVLNVTSPESPRNKTTLRPLEGFLRDSDLEEEESEPESEFESEFEESESESLLDELVSVSYPEEERLLLEPEVDEVEVEVEDFQELQEDGEGDVEVE